MDISEFEKELQKLAKQLKLSKSWLAEEYLSPKTKRNEEDFITAKICDILEDSEIKAEASQLFLKELSKTGCDAFDSIIKEISSQKEYNEGKNRPDIVITLEDGKTIIIENKILAEDQPNQLYRYSTPNPNWLFFLTRFGHKASEDSEKSEDGKTILKEGKDYFCISYYKHIFNWLKKLHEKFVDNKKIEQLFLWLRLNIVSCPEIFELILENKESVEEILKRDISDESLQMIKLGCHEGDENPSNGDAPQGFVRFYNYIVWGKLFSILSKFAEENGFKLIVSDRFEFKNKGQYFTFQKIGDPKIEFKFYLDKRRYGDTWDGVSFNGKPLKHSRWDFLTLLNYDSPGGLLEEITDKLLAETSL